MKSKPCRWNTWKATARDETVPKKRTGRLRRKYQTPNDAVIVTELYFYFKPWTHEGMVSFTRWHFASPICTALHSLFIELPVSFWGFDGAANAHLSSTPWGRSGHLTQPGQSWFSVALFKVICSKDEHVTQAKPMEVFKGLGLWMRQECTFVSVSGLMNS